MTALRLIVVDDDAMIAVLLGEMLTGMGYDVCAIETNEADAVTAALACKPDLIIIDAQLGNGSGIDAIAKILKTRKVPYVFISGDIARIRALKPSAIVLQKPFHEAELSRAIQAALHPA